MTQRDETRLRALIPSAGAGEGQSLKSLVDGAKIVSSQEIPNNTVTMNSRVRLKDLESGHELEVDLLFPHNMNENNDALSILSSQGIALFGLSEGETVQWTDPNGSARRLKVLSVLWQPEAEGLFQF
ncbi:MAG: GreA/GreB family elongation factor [Verrucomicrobia bacterium]|nr:GreA/GreB family elongation factor [Verrucomicrobiota bacterium]